jgi:hypothetical protein
MLMDISSEMIRRSYQRRISYCVKLNR